MVFTKVLNSATVFNIISEGMFLEQQISVLEWFPKDPVTLKTGVVNKLITIQNQKRKWLHNITLLLFWHLIKTLQKLSPNIMVMCVYHNFDWPALERFHCILCRVWWFQLLSFSLYPSLSLSVSDSQLPIKTGQQSTHTKVSTEHNKECLINISKYKFALVINGLTNILKNVNNMVSLCL